MLKFIQNTCNIMVIMLTLMCTLTACSSVNAKEAKQATAIDAYRGESFEYHL